MDPFHKKIASGASILIIQKKMASIQTALSDLEESESIGRFQEVFQWLSESARACRQADGTLQTEWEGLRCLLIAVINGS